MQGFCCFICVFELYGRVADKLSTFAQHTSTRRIEC